MNKRKLADELRLRVNPQFDHDIDPEENEFAYWNPVSAANDLVKLANAALDVTQAVTDSMKEKTRVRLERRRIERQIHTIEQQLLVLDPPSPSETKTTKLVSAAVERRAIEADQANMLAELREAAWELERREVELEGEVDIGTLWAKTNEKVSENIKTALSFYKDEKKRAYQF